MFIGNCITVAASAVFMMGEGMANSSMMCKGAVTSSCNASRANAQTGHTRDD